MTKSGIQPAHDNSFLKWEMRFSRFDTRLFSIGNGTSGKVEIYESKSKSGFNYAVKTYYKKEKYDSKTEYKEKVLHEYNILSKLKNDHIIKVFKYHVSLTGNTIKLYLEAGLDFSSLIKQLPSSDLIAYCKQLCAGVLYLHSLDICHRDLKLENLVIVNDTLKIIDFLTAHECNGQLSIGLVGSPKYAAPETFQFLKYDGKTADIWSIGIILYHLLTLKFPWRIAKSDDEKYQRFVNDKSSIGLESNDFAKILDGALEIIPSNRITILDIVRLLDE